jgi:hypothetical protein
MSVANIKPLEDCVKLLAHLIADSIKASHDKNSIARVMEFSNILGDLVVLIPEMGNISLEGLSASDITHLASVLGENLGDAKAAAVSEAAVKCVEDICNVIVPDIQAVIAAVKK